MRSEELLNPRDAAHALGISYPTVKQWIYKKKLRSVQTAGGHHRIPASEIERFLPRNDEQDALAAGARFWGAGGGTKRTHRPYGGPRRCAVGRRKNRVRRRPDASI